MITEEQAQEMMKQISYNYKELRKYHVQKLLDKHKLKAGCRIKLGGKTYQLPDFDTLCEYNDLRSYYPDLYGRLVKVNGELSKNAYRIYIFTTSTYEIVNE